MSDAAGSHPQHALILESDSSTATYVREVLEQLQLHTTIARSLPRAWAAVTVPPPTLLLLSLQPGDVTAHLEFASLLAAVRGTACVFVIDRLDHDAERAISTVGDDTSVLCKPLHRGQLEATCMLALRQSVRSSRNRSSVKVQSSVRERQLERAVRAIGEAATNALRFG